MSLFKDSPINQFPNQSVHRRHENQFDRVVYLVTQESTDAPVATLLTGGPTRSSNDFLKTLTLSGIYTSAGVYKFSLSSDLPTGVLVIPSLTPPSSVDPMSGPSQVFVSNDVSSIYISSSNVNGDPTELDTLSNGNCYLTLDIYTI